MKRRSNRVLTWALAISLAAHAVLIYLAQGMKVGEAGPVEHIPPMKIVRVHAPKPTPPPVPTPQPRLRALPQRHAVAPPRLPVVANVKDTAGQVQPYRPPVVVGPPGPGTDPVSPGPVATDSPGPTCSAPFVDAKAIDPVTPDTPPLAEEEGLTGTAQVRVTLDSDGRATSATIFRSSGSSLLDSAAVLAAKRSSYRAEVRDCTSVEGSYLFTATFQ